MAPRRNGGPDRRETNVLVARRRPRRRGPRHACSASARYAGGTPANAQAAQETGARTEAAGHRQAGLLRLGFPETGPTCPHERGLRKNNRAETPIKLCGDESARCSGSSRLDPPSAFSMSIPLYTTPSTINDIWSFGRPFACSEPKPPPGGKMRLPSHETRFDLAASLDRTPLP